MAQVGRHGPKVGSRLVLFPMQNQNVNAEKLQQCHLLTFDGVLLLKNLHFVHCMASMKYQLMHLDITIVQKFVFSFI